MSEYDDLLPEEPHDQAREQGIEYVDETGAPEVMPESKDAHLEGKVVSLPPLTTAADLLAEDDPLAGLPQEPADEDTPPDDAAPTFIITPATAARRESVRFADGTPVGVWLDQTYPDADGGFVSEQLILMGLDGELAAWFGIQRNRAREARAQLMADPGVAAFADEEARRRADKQAIQDAFVKAQKGKA